MKVPVNRQHKVCVSVICTLYRTPQQLLETAIRSILNQQDVEHELILVVDDDIPEKSLPEPIAKALASHTTIRIIRVGRVGRGKALNVGVTSARHSFVAIQDADDVSHPRRLSYQAGILQQAPNLAACCVSYLHIKQEMMDVTWPVVPSCFPEPEVVNDELPWRNPLIHSGMMFRKAALTRVGGYSETRSSQLDYDVYLRLSSESLYIVKSPLIMVGKRVHSNQYFEQQGVSRIIKSFELQARHIKQLPFQRRLSCLTFALARALWRCMLWLPKRMSIQRVRSGSAN